MGTALVSTKRPVYCLPNRNHNRRLSQIPFWWIGSHSDTKFPHHPFIPYQHAWQGTDVPTTPTLSSVEECVNIVKKPHGSSLVVVPVEEPHHPLRGLGDDLSSKRLRRRRWQLWGAATEASASPFVVAGFWRQPATPSWWRFSRRDDSAMTSNARWYRLSPAQINIWVHRPKLPPSVGPPRWTQNTQCVLDEPCISFCRDLLWASGKIRCCSRWCRHLTPFQAKWLGFGCCVGTLAVLRSQR